MCIFQNILIFYYFQSGLKKKREMDPTQWSRVPKKVIDVIGWWEKIREFHENPREANAIFSEFETYHRRHKTKDAWYTILHKLIEQKWFMGYMTREEVAAQEKVFKDSYMRFTFFVYLDRSGDIVLSHSVYTDLPPAGVWSKHEQYRDASEWENIFSDIERTRDDLREGCKYPLVRSKALIFKKEIYRRSRAAVDLWTLLGTRSGVPKDIRFLVAKLIWYGRHEWMDPPAVNIEMPWNNRPKWEETPTDYFMDMPFEK